MSKYYNKLTLIYYFCQVNIMDSRVMNTESEINEETYKSEELNEPLYDFMYRQFYTFNKQFIQDMGIFNIYSIRAKISFKYKDNKITPMNECIIFIISNNVEKIYNTSYMYELLRNLFTASEEDYEGKPSVAIYDVCNICVDNILRYYNKYHITDNLHVKYYKEPTYEDITQPKKGHFYFINGPDDQDEDDFGVDCLIFPLDCCRNIYEEIFIKFYIYKFKIYSDIDYIIFNMFNAQNMSKFLRCDKNRLYEDYIDYCFEKHNKYIKVPYIDENDNKFKIKTIDLTPSKIFTEKVYFK